jgi:hypothetical protein
VSTYRVVDGRGRTVLETDDWVEACTAALSAAWSRKRSVRRVRGTHPTHDWGPPHEGQRSPDPRCVKCGAWDNGSYGSVAPCGYDFSGQALVTALWKETQARKAASGGH